MTKRVHHRAEPSTEVELPQRESKHLPSRPQKVNKAELRREVMQRLSKSRTALVTPGGYVAALA